MVNATSSHPPTTQNKSKTKTLKTKLVLNDPGKMQRLMLAAASAALGWGLTSLLGFRLLPFGSAIFQAVVAIALYPTLAVLFGRAHRSIAAPEQA